MMMPRRSRSQQGAFKFSSLVWLSLLGSAVYFGVMYLPVYAEVYQMREIIQEVGNKYWRVEMYDVDKMKKELLDRAKEIGATIELVEGREKKLSGIIVLADDIFVTRDDAIHKMIIQVNYDRYIKYPFLDRNTKLKFSPSMKFDTDPTIWNKK